MTQNSKGDRSTDRREHPNLNFAKGKRIGDRVAWVTRKVIGPDREMAPVGPTT